MIWFVLQIVEGSLFRSDTSSATPPRGHRASLGKCSIRTEFLGEFGYDFSFYVAGLKLG
jgi:hypothetical protein